MYDLLRVECSSLYIAPDIVGSEFPMAFGCLNLLKSPAINLNFFLPPTPVTLNYVNVSQVNLSGNIKMDQSYNTE